jgi:hypothetical protein
MGNRDTKRRKGTPYISMASNPYGIEKGKISAEKKG